MRCVSSEEFAWVPRGSFFRYPSRGRTAAPNAVFWYRGRREQQDGDRERRSWLRTASAVVRSEALLWRQSHHSSRDSKTWALAVSSGVLPAPEAPLRGAQGSAEHPRKAGRPQARAAFCSPSHLLRMPVRPTLAKEQGWALRATVPRVSAVAAIGRDLLAGLPPRLGERRSKKSHHPSRP